MAPDDLLTDQNPLPTSIVGDLRRQLTFIVEVDRMKAVLRQSVTAAVDRRENDAEHSWHLALMALVLADRAAVPVDVARVVELVVLHDLVEVYAGDTPLHDDVDLAEQAVREADAADRLYGLLPAEQGARLRAAWEEFEAHATPEARFARAMDRLQPLLLSWVTRGAAMDERATVEGVRRRLRVIEDGSPELWAAAETLIDESARRGFLAG